MTEILFKYLDYSSGTISGAAIKAAGYRGSIRYITAPNLMNPPGANQKHMTQAEYADHKANGLDVVFVFQGSTTDADGGFTLGVSNAEKALAGLKYLGAPLDSPVFFTNDRPDLPNPGAWQGYLQGAKAVLGRVGAYGFGNAMDAASGIATWFWQAGRQSDVRSFVHVYQWNNGSATVGGRVCDINYVYKPLVQTQTGDTMSADDAYNGVARMIKDMGNGGATDLSDALRWALGIKDLQNDVSAIKQGLTTVQAAQGGVNPATLDALRTELSPLFDLAERLKD